MSRRLRFPGFTNERRATNAWRAGTATLVGAVAWAVSAATATATVTNTWVAPPAIVGNWADAGNWATPEIPTNPGDVANLLVSSTTTNVITTAVTVGTIKAGGSGGFRVNLSGGSLTFDSGSSEKAWLQQMSGNGRCNIPFFTLNSDLDLVVSNGQYFDINGFAGSHDIHLNRTTGTGTPYVGGNNTAFFGNFYIHAGILMFTGEPFGHTSTGTRLITIYNNAALRNNGTATLNANRRIVVGTGGGRVMANSRVMRLNAADQLAGSGTLTMTESAGWGVLVLGGANDGFTGSVVVGTGAVVETLVLNASGSINNAPLITLANSVATLAVTNKPSGYSVPAGQTVAGVGTVLGVLNVDAASATVHPGSYTLPGPVTNPGKLTVAGGLALSNGGAYLWDLKALKDDGTGTAGTDFGTIDVTSGAVALAGGTLTLGFVGAAAAGPDSGDPFWTTDHVWTVLTATTAPTGALSVSNNGFTKGSFKTQVVDNTLQLVYSLSARTTMILVR